MGNHCVKEAAIFAGYCVGKQTASCKPATCCNHRTSQELYDSDPQTPDFERRLAASKASRKPDIKSEPVE